MRRVRGDEGPAGSEGRLERRREQRQRGLGVPAGAEKAPTFEVDASAGGRVHARSRRRLLDQPLAGADVAAESLDAGELRQHLGAAGVVDLARELLAQASLAVSRSPKSQRARRRSVTRTPYGLASGITAPRQSQRSRSGSTSSRSTTSRASAVVGSARDDVRLGRVEDLGLALRCGQVRDDRVEDPAVGRVPGVGRDDGFRQRAKRVRRLGGEIEHVREALEPGELELEGREPSEDRRQVLEERRRRSPAPGRTGRGS